QKLEVVAALWIASICLLVATASGQDRILPELPRATTPVTPVAASDPVTGKSEFRYQHTNTPPVIRVQPGTILNVEYKNELDAQSREECVGHPCMNMTNLLSIRSEEHTSELQSLRHLVCRLLLEKKKKILKKIIIRSSNIS